MKYVKILKTLMLFLRIKDGEIREWENSFKRGKCENKNLAQVNIVHVFNFFKIETSIQTNVYSRFRTSI